MAWVETKSDSDLVQNNDKGGDDIKKNNSIIVYFW